MSKKMVRNLLLLMIFNFFSIAYAQRVCGFDPIHDAKYKEETNTQRLTYKILNESNKFLSKTTEEGIVVVPVVVHVLYNNSTQNISEAQILSQIDVLNEDFRKLNSDANNTPNPFKPFVADAEIQFELADFDPDGNETTGIVRKNVNFTINDTDNRFYREDLGGSAAWDTNQYLNIWVGEMAETIDGTLLGFASSPASVGKNGDGVVVNYIAFGTNGTAEFPVNKGRTATHEVGHYFNLFHIWGPDKFTPCSLADDDGILDTPNQRGPTYEFPTFPDLDPATNCPDTGPNGTMFMNYMDYVYDEAMFMFTENQKTRMQNALNGPRSGLINSVGFTCLRDYYPDNDKDGLGDNNASPIESCSPIPGFSRNNYDTNDNEFIDVLVLGSVINNRTFEINQKIGIVRNVEIYDRNGKLLQTDRPNKIQPKIELNFAVEGIYFLVIKTDHSTYRKKVVLKY